MPSSGSRKFIGKGNHEMQARAYIDGYKSATQGVPLTKDDIGLSFEELRKKYAS